MQWSITRQQCIVRTPLYLWLQAHESGNFSNIRGDRGEISRDAKEFVVEPTAFQ